ncbi:hypothetical protein OIU84_001522 [Salix udensis]|uniref:Uncharacterized protein n=1 Tax=Salix udensis TaxID=889485 RepID=A0AAD6P6U3_9ROSI|nr:hypothetical protein OIU84_001522 [Salix udensis]
MSERQSSSWPLLRRNCYLFDQALQRDAVPRKKPDPVHFISLDGEVIPPGFGFMQLKPQISIAQNETLMAIYTLAANTLCVVVEDSAIGLAAAKAAGMKSVVTKSA